MTFKVCNNKCKALHDQHGPALPVVPQKRTSWNSEENPSLSWTHYDYLCDLGMAFDGRRLPNFIYIGGRKLVGGRTLEAWRKLKMEMEEEKELEAMRKRSKVSEWGTDIGLNTWHDPKLPDLHCNACESFFLLRKPSLTGNWDWEMEMVEVVAKKQNNRSFEELMAVFDVEVTNTELTDLPNEESNHELKSESESCGDESSDNESSDNEFFHVSTDNCTDNEYTGNELIINQSIINAESINNESINESNDTFTGNESHVSTNTRTNEMDSTRDQYIFSNEYNGTESESTGTESSYTELTDNEATDNEPDTESNKTKSTYVSDDESTDTEWTYLSHDESII